ncbi:MAG: DUF4443 domain-containing protein [Promethearchaeota archaeon]|jgi:predicted transcriptional regulator
MNTLIFDELGSLFESSTIKPSFEKIHVILALFIFDENPEGIGRYRLQKELMIGEGTAKSLIKKLNEKKKFVTVVVETKRKGHVLTELGLNFLGRIRAIIPIIQKGDSSIIKDIIIDGEEVSAYFCLVKNVSNKITDGIAQRDAAIRVNGSGATCLVYDGENLVFPSKSYSGNDNINSEINEAVYKYFEVSLSEKKVKLEKNDVIAIGSGESPQKARIATLNAALTLI